MHLGIPLSSQPAAAATALHTAIVTKVEARIARWSGFRLSMLGRAYVAKQVLASMVTYHATFVPVPRELLERLCRAIHTFVAANRPVTGSAAALFPGKATCFRAGKDGGIALVDLSAQILALQAKMLGRLLEPEQLDWKAFFDFWLHRSAACLAAQEPASLSARHQHIWQLSRFLIFSSSQQSGCRPRRACGSTCTLTRSCSLIAACSHTSSATTRSSASRSLQQAAHRRRRAASCLGGLGQARPRQGQSPSRPVERPGAPAKRHPPSPLAALPASWRQLIQVQPAAALWLACLDPVECRVWSRTAAGHDQLSHTVSSTGALVQQTTEHRLVSTRCPLRPRSRRWCSTGTSLGPGTRAPGKRQQPGAQEQEEDALVPPAAAATLYLFGLWGSQILDPQARVLGLWAGT